MPFNDKYMVYNDADGRYYLTEESLISKGINLRARWNDANEGGAAVAALLSDATSLVYNYAHEGVFDTSAQDRVLANNQEARPYLYRALLAMAISLARYGNRLDSAEESERAIAVPAQVKAEFDIILPSLGHTLRYAGRWQ